MSENDSEPVAMQAIILKQYELTDAYHDQKTQSAWIASSVYFAFSAGFLGFWAKFGNTDLQVIATVFVLVVFLSAMSFISLQFRHRWDSVKRTGMYHWVFDNHWSCLHTGHDFRELKRRYQKREYKREFLGVTSHAM